MIPLSAEPPAIRSIADAAGCRSKGSSCKNQCTTILHPCYFGTDIPSEEQLIAHNRTIDQICEPDRSRFLIVPAGWNGSMRWQKDCRSALPASMESIRSIRRRKISAVSIHGNRKGSNCFEGLHICCVDRKKIREELLSMNDRYQSPLSERYASKEMQYIFPRIKSLKPGENYGLPWQRPRRNWD